MDDPLPPDINSEQTALFDGASYNERLQYFREKWGAYIGSFVRNGVSSRKLPLFIR
jgi:hypothetical protein